MPKPNKPMLWCHLTDQRSQISDAAVVNSNRPLQHPWTNDASFTVHRRSTNKSLRCFTRNQRCTIYVQRIPNHSSTASPSTSINCVYPWLLPSLSKHFRARWSIHPYPTCAAALCTIRPRVATLGSQCHSPVASFPTFSAARTVRRTRLSSHLRTLVLSAMADLQIVRQSKWCKGLGGAIK
jgi:hypothetical protein